MTPVTDDDAFEAAFEAFLAGRSAPPAAEGLVAFADGVRASAARPPRPNAALAELLATGLLTDQSSAPAPRAVRPRRRSTRRMFLAFFAKIASAGLAAKAATVTGVVVVGVSTAGFTGALPGDLQHGFATVVDSTTPLTAPDPSATPSIEGTDGESTEPGDEPTTTTPAPPATAGSDDPAGSDDAGTAPADTTSGNGLGSQVSELAHQGKTAGGTASTLAHERNEARHSAGSSDDSSGATTGGDDTADDSGHATTGSDDSAEHESGDDSAEHQSGDDSSHRGGTSGGSGSGSQGKGRSNG